MSYAILAYGHTYSLGHVYERISTKLNGAGLMTGGSWKASELYYASREWKPYKSLLCAEVDKFLKSQKLSCVECFGLDHSEQLALCAQSTVFEGNGTDVIPADHFVVLPDIDIELAEAALMLGIEAIPHQKGWYFAHGDVV